MKVVIPFLMASCFYLTSAVEGQQQRRPTSQATSVIAQVTFLDGSHQEWEKVEFGYSGGTTLPYFKYGADATRWAGRVTGKDLSLDQKTGVITDRVLPEAGVSIKADYSTDLRFKNLVLTARPEVEGRIIGTKCDTGLCVEKPVRVKGLWRMDGQTKDRSAYLVPADQQSVTDKADFIRAISFVAR
jgi:hypothetical protein